jgi:hypothetical protein
MASAINVGSINLPKMMRHLSHRSSQVRDLTFIRDAIKQKDVKTTKSGGTLEGPPVSFGYEKSASTALTGVAADTVYHASSPEIVLPGLTMLQSPIVSRRGRLEKSGHRISGACTFYAPSLDYIKALDNFKDTVAFSELESYDKLIDIERIIQQPTDRLVGYTGDQTFDLSPGSTYPAGYEIDRLQFKIKSTNNLVDITLTGIDTSSKTIVWAATDTFTPTDWVSNLIIDMSGSASVELRDIYLYKEAEWRIESIKDYRDEYMQLAAVRVRGNRASRRRSYG